MNPNFKILVSQLLRRFTLEEQRFVMDSQRDPLVCLEFVQLGVETAQPDPNGSPAKKKESFINEVNNGAKQQQFSALLGMRRQHVGAYTCATRHYDCCNGACDAALEMRHWHGDAHE
ncbi:hypothetical protein HAX54_010804, partial [Datura stramonium]|nr:hypothetical protein [Datura stramonium]